MLGHIEHGIEVGLDHHVPIFAAHFEEHAVAGDAGVVHQHIDHAMLGLGFGEGRHGGIPVAHIAHRGVKGVAQSGLLPQPLGVVTGRTATGDHFEAFFVQALANGGTDTTHAAGHVRNFLTHRCLLFVN